MMVEIMVKFTSNTLLDDVTKIDPSKLDKAALEKLKNDRIMLLTSSTYFVGPHLHPHLLIITSCVLLLHE